MLRTPHCSQLRPARVHWTTGESVGAGGWGVGVCAVAVVDNGSSGGEL